MRDALPLLAAALLAACSTTYVAPPAARPLNTQASAFEIRNEQIDTEPRVYFSDGISTYTTHYQGWTDELARALQGRLGPGRSTEGEKKVVGVSIQAILCTGHYVPDCTITAVVTTGSGYKRSVSSSTYTGYPISSAMEKAINGVASAIASDIEVTGYLLR